MGQQAPELGLFILNLWTQQNNTRCSDVLFEFGVDVTSTPFSEPRLSFFVPAHGYVDTSFLIRAGDENNCLPVNM